jgi:DNA repair protein RecN (Recombination protein N)
VIERLFAKELLSFDRVELEFAPGLVVFSGPSGAGKSVLMGQILAGFGLSDSLAQTAEVTLRRPEGLESELYDLDAILTIKLLRKNSVRCYLDGQSIPRKGLREMFAPYVYYLSVRDRGGFESERLIGLIDRALEAQEPEYADQLAVYRERYMQYRADAERLAAIWAQEAEQAERIEFLRYEIDKIRSIDPQEEEFDTLMTTKRQLSRIEKIREAIAKAQAMFAAEEAAEEMYALLERDGSYLSDALNQLRADMDAAEELAEELAETDVEAVLDRLEALSGLIKRHGSIAEALDYLADKEAELAAFEHIEEDKSTLEAAIAEHKTLLQTQAQMLHEARRRQARRLETLMAGYLGSLKLPPVRFVFETVDLNETGIDRIDLAMEGSTTATLSGGEHNRLRLALMAAALHNAPRGQGVVILDEIDANVSGDESIAIAEMIADLARAFQVFAISHQPHLAAQADQHILITRDTHSHARELDTEGRVREIARIIGGEEADEEAVAFARKLMGV